MKVNGKACRTIWKDNSDPLIVKIIDQQILPWRFETVSLKDWKEAAEAILNMTVRGAGLIGATAGYGMALAAQDAPVDSHASWDKWMNAAAQGLKSTRPTAVNLAWAVDRQLRFLRKIADLKQRALSAVAEADRIADEDAECCRKIGEHGLQLIQALASKKPAGEPVRILTHCNAGWLAFVDFGSATAPIYAAHDAGISVEVWVEETRPRNQGAALTAWELGQHGVPHQVIVDNAGGHVMQRGWVDLVITGTDRVTRVGDVANKIGTYKTALAAQDNGIPFYVALPSSTFDWAIEDGIRDIPIEERDSTEVSSIQGWDEDRQTLCTIKLAPDSSPCRNYGFDVTPARLVSGLITERGICSADGAGIRALFSENFENNDL